MSSSAYFPSGLNQWAGSDIPQRMDFVNDNEILDQALADLRENTGNMEQTIESMEQDIVALRSENENLNGTIDDKSIAYANTASMENGGLVVASQAPEGKTAYCVNVEIPDGYTAAQSFILDNTPVTVTGPDMQPTTLDAAPGAVVSLVRKNGLVFPKLGGGEGADVSLRVIASTTQPANPTAGTVWVNTSMPLPHKNAYVLASAFADASLLPEGFIGIQATTVTPDTANSVNALKKGALHLVISRLYQNQGGVLQVVPGAYYTGSTWVPIVTDLTLFSANNQHSSITGGYYVYNTGTPGSDAASSIGDTLYVRGGGYGSYGGKAITHNKEVDCSAYKYCNVDCEMSVTGSRAAISFGAARFATTTSRKIVKLNIESLASGTFVMQTDWDVRSYIYVYSIILSNT